MKRPDITPGPWEIYGSDYADVRPVDKIAQGAANGIVAQCPGYKQEREANAQAIAALPDLLSALENVLVAFDDLPDSAFYQVEGTHQQVKEALTEAGYTF